MKVIKLTVSGQSFSIETDEANVKLLKSVLFKRIADNMIVFDALEGRKQQPVVIQKTTVAKQSPVNKPSQEQIIRGIAMGMAKADAMAGNGSNSVASYMMDATAQYNQSKEV